MNTHDTYLLIDLLCILVPLLFSFHPKIRFYKHWQAFMAACLPIAIFFLVWDALFTKMGIWGFNSRYVTGIYIANLPLEEILFFFCIPYAAVFSYYCFKMFYDVGRHIKLAALFSWVLLTCLFIVALLHYSRLYTSVTFVLLGVLLLFLLFKKVSFLPGFYLSFIFILIPFFISNGILTGSFLLQPVVMYNDHYNLGIRLYTIPLEDIFYAMLLLLLNVWGFEYFSEKGKINAR